MLASVSESDQGLTSPTFSPTDKPVPVGANDHRAQREWEHFQVTKGIERYRRSLVRENKHGQQVAKGLEETTPGHRIATELIGPMVEAVKEAQAKAASTVQDPNVKKLPDDVVGLTLLPAETLAACAVLTALANPVDASYLSVRIACAARVRHEVEYQEWRRAEAAAEKHRKETGEDGFNLFKLMLKRNDGEVDKRAFDKWSKKAALFVKQDWTQDVKVRVGDVLMSLLIESNGWFKVEERFVPETGKTKLVFGMTETALALTSALGAQCELQRPFMAPMICEPADYEFIADQPADK